MTNITEDNSEQKCKANAGKFAGLASMYEGIP